MTKLKQIDHLIRYWEAAETKATDQWNFLFIEKCISKINALKVARAIIKGPSNTQMHMDTKPCENCNIYRDSHRQFNFCPDCGMALSQ